MLFHGVLRGTECEIIEFSFESNYGNTIQIELIDAPFEHFFLQVWNPFGALVGVFTFKTRQKIWKISSINQLCSNGAVCTDETIGIWKFAIVSPGQVHGDVSLEIDSYNETTTHTPLEKQGNVSNTMKRWYAGDLHLHTNLSDGRIELSDVKKAFDHSGLDFLSITDHSICLTKSIFSSNQLIMGTEITWDNFGHYNVHGIQSIQELDYHKYCSTHKTKHEALSKILSQMNNQERIITLNHPFPYDWNLGHPLDLRLFQCYEVINAPHLLFEEVDNNKAIAFYDYLWSCGFRLTAVGGSDAHKENYYGKYPIGKPTTHIYCDGLSNRNLLEGLKNGNTIVTSFEDVELVFFKDGIEVLPGEYHEGNIECVGRSKSDISWNIIKNGHCIDSIYGNEIHTTFSIEQDSFVRLEAVNKKGQRVLITTPIHAMSKTPNEFELLTHVNQFLEREK